MRLFFLSLFLTILPSNSNAYYIDHMKLQFAGELGLLSYGLGKQINPKYNIDFIYGYVPQEIGGHEIETYAFKNQYIFTFLEYKKIIFMPYMGGALYHVVGLKYQTNRSASYPRNYYRFASLRVLLYLGIEVVKFDSKHSGYFEAGMNDIWIINYMNNNKMIDPKDYVSLALGYKFYID